MGCSPWGREESDTTERLHFHFSLSCTGEVNGNPLQYYCLENPRDGGAWWASVYGVTQGQTRLKQLSSSSSRGNKRKSCLCRELVSIPVKITSDMRSEVGGFPYRAQKLGQQESEPQARGKMDVLC